MNKLPCMDLPNKALSNQMPKSVRYVFTKWRFVIYGIYSNGMYNTIIQHDELKGVK